MTLLAGETAICGPREADAKAVVCAVQLLNAASAAVRCNYARSLACYDHRLFTAVQLMRASFALRSRRRRRRSFSPSLLGSTANALFSCWH